MPVPKAELALATTGSPVLERPALPNYSARGHRRLRAHMQLRLIDVLGMTGGYALTLLMPAGTTHQAVDAGVLLGLMAMYLVIASHFGAYAMDAFQGGKAGIGRAILSFLIPLNLAGLLAMNLGADSQLIEILLLRVSPAVCLGLATVRTLFAIHAGSRSDLDDWPVTLVLNDGADEVEMPRGATVIDANKYGLRPDITDPDALDALGTVVNRADRVIVACPADRRESWAVALKGANVDAEIITAEIAMLGPIGAGNFFGHTTIKVSTGPLALRDRALKRLFDIVVGTAAILCLLPIMLVTAIAVRLDSPGPIIFKQKRIGRGNRIFYMQKFRSMHVAKQDADGSRLTTGKDDDRITRVGRFIRATSIDELPQLFDVVRGDMSIVGPRPHALGAKAGDTLYWHVDPRYWHRHAVKPGMTGLAQVRGFRGTTFTHSDLTDRLQADLEYLSGWTLLRDILITALTVKVLVGSKTF
ncbi:MAG: sugar transferase [Sphingobium sp.]